MSGADIRPLAAGQLRFPRPATPADIWPVTPGELTAVDLHRLIHDPRGIGWQHIFAWKAYMHFLVAGGWVFKTNAWYCDQDARKVAATIEVFAERGRRLGVWHPRKQWFIVREGGDYWAGNATPQLPTLAELGIAGEQAWWRSALWHGRRLGMSLFILFRHRLLLDTKPTNFVVDPARGALYYIDDEFYHFASWADLLQRRSRLLQ